MLLHFKKSNEILETWSPHCKNLAFQHPPSLNFHNRTDASSHGCGAREVEVLRYHGKIFPNLLCQNSGLWRPSGAYGYDECGLRIKKTNIVGGETAKFGDYPYMALLGSSQQNPRSKKIETFYTCGGSLINKWYVLTAAHCVQTETGDKIELR